MKILIIIFSFLSFYSCKQKENTIQNIENTSQRSENNSLIDINNFIGEWNLDNDSKNNTTFSLHLSKNYETIEGYYCAVTRNGSKIDCSPTKENNIKVIRIEKDKIIVSFYSFFGAKNGEAELTFSNNKIHWKVTKQPNGEFYCPLDAYLIKINDNLTTAVNNNNKTIHSSKNYKGQDITMQLYKTIIEKYSCGGYSVNGAYLGKQYDYEVYIVENDCGDFPFKDLLSLNEGKIIDKLTIESSSFDIEKYEQQNVKDKTDITFIIKNLSNIEITTNHTIKGKVIESKKNVYYLNQQGKLSKIIESDLIQTNKFLQLILCLFFITISCKKNDSKESLTETKAITIQNNTSLVADKSNKKNDSIEISQVEIKNSKLIGM